MTFKNILIFHDHKFSHDFGNPVYIYIYLSKQQTYSDKNIESLLFNKVTDIKQQEITYSTTLK
jgi:hypothetical protein